MKPQDTEPVPAPIRVETPRARARRPLEPMPYDPVKTILSLASGAALAMPVLLVVWVLARRAHPTESGVHADNATAEASPTPRGSSPGGENTAPPALEVRPAPASVEAKPNAASKATAPVSSSRLPASAARAAPPAPMASASAPASKPAPTVKPVDPPALQPVWKPNW